MRTPPSSGRDPGESGPAVRRHTRIGDAFYLSWVGLGAQQMEGVNFSSSGTRWRVSVIGDPALPVAAQAGESGRTGLLFVSQDGEHRFLALDPDTVPSIDSLRDKPNDELGRLVWLAVPIGS